MIRLALIGGGPKALFALLALHDRLLSTPSALLTVDVYDPLPPGSGSVWRSSQPDVLRLNVKANIVDASSSLNGENYLAWAKRTAPDMAGDKYPPRTLVGRYLREQFELLSRYGHFPVIHLPSVVTGVEREGSLWHVSGAFGVRAYDEILLATGHGLAQALPSVPMPGALNAQPLIGDYGSLTEEGIAPDSAVWIRGAALTAYDVALLLTEGRGGSWRPTDDGGHATGLRYLPSGREPRLITLASRSGSLMDPKSETVPAAVAASLEAHKELLRHWGREARKEGLDVGLAGLWAVLLNCAQDCARLMGANVTAVSLWRTALSGCSVEAGVDAVNPAPGMSPAARLRNSLAVNQLRAPVTTGWLWARVWSGLYADLVRAMDRLPRSTGEWRRFARVARNLERFTFGPPEITARKLVALFDAGILRLADAGELPPQDAVLIDAVTPGPGVLPAPAPGGRPRSAMIAGLLQAGLVSVRAGDRGLLTAPDGTALARDGSRTESLAALGRPTEDPTLGHDTLNRTLHDEYCLWAQRIAALVTDGLDP